MNADRLHYRFRGLIAIGVMLALLVVAAAACADGDSNDERAESTPAPTPVATETELVSDETLALLRDLAPALLQESDLPERFEERRNDIRPVSRAEVPGLTSGAAAQFLAFAVADGTDSVQASVVLPERPSDVATLLERFASRSYISALTGDAPDAQTAEVSVPDAPEDSRALDYSGTVAGPEGARTLDGRALAFAHGRVYIVLVHASHGAPREDIGLGAIASRIDERLAAYPEAAEGQADE